MKKKDREFADLMARLDPFPSHDTQRRYDVWMSELSQLEAALETGDYTTEAAKNCGGGGRRGHVEARIKHIKAKLAETSMRTVAAKQRRASFA